jgi:hypothetical protein
LLDACGNPSLLVKARQLHRLNVDLLIKEPINWAPFIDFLLIEECTTPKQCSIAVVSNGFAKGRLISSPVLGHIEKLLHMIYRGGNVKGKQIDSLLIKPTPATTTPANTRGAVRIWPSNTSLQQETKLT